MQFALFELNPFGAFYYFDNPFFTVFAYSTVIIGLVIQMVCFKKAKKRIGRYIPIVICFIGCVFCELMHEATTWMGQLAIDVLYHLFVYLLIGEVLGLLFSSISRIIKQG